MLIIILLLILPLTICLRCSSLASINNAIFIQKDTFSGFTEVEIEGLIIGQVDSSYYLLYYLSTSVTTYYSAIRKLNLDGSLAWMIVVPIFSILKSFAVDSNEQNVYLSSYKNPMDTIRFQASNGAVVDAITQ